METYVPMKDGDDAPLRLLTHVTVEPAHISDAHALLPAIEGATALGLSPKEVLADSLYGSEKNVEKAARMGTELVAPVPGGEKKSKSSFLSAFTFTEDGKVTSCPTGKAPIRDEAVGNHREVLFGVSDCLGCPKREECPIKSVREGYGFSYDKKQVKMARRRAAEKTAAFKDRYRHRSGVESTMSAFDRLTGVKHLRVRGMEAVRFAVMLKAVGVNLYRAAAAWKRNNGGNPGGIGAFEHVLLSLLCLHAAFWSMVRRWFIASASGCHKWPPLAARTV